MFSCIPSVNMKRIHCLLVGDPKVGKKSIKLAFCTEAVASSDDHEFNEYWKEIMINEEEVSLSKFDLTTLEFKSVLYSTKGLMT